LGFKDAETAKKSIQLIKKADRTHAHKIQAAMAMEQRARFHPNATKGIKDAQKIYADFIEEMKEKTKAMRNPTFRGIQEAHEHYNYPGSHRTGTIIKDGIVIRTYSNNEGHDIVKDDGDTIQYMIKTPEIRSAFLDTRKQGRSLRFFLKTGPNEVTDMGMYEIGRLSGKFVNLRKATKSNPSRTPEGRKIPKKYLKGLNKAEMMIAAREIDKGYKYDTDDPEAYEEWKSDIKAKARGYETVPSKYKKKFVKMYGPLPEKGDFITKISKATGIKKSILKEVEKKGLAAWRTGHRVGANQHAWARGRVYSFVTVGNTVKKGNKKMGDYKLAVEAGLVKENPSRYREAAGGIVMEGDRILLLRRSTKETSKHGMWEFPGGKLEEGETAEEAAIIETKEESGLDVVVKGKAGEHIDHRKEKVYHAFFVEPANVNQEVKLSEEHDQSLWVTIDEALAMEESKLSHHARHFLEQMVRNNPGWRHGEQMENDPFADEFEE